MENTIEKMDQSQGLEILVKVAEMAQAKGLFTFAEAEMVHKAIKCFMKEEDSSINLPN